MTRSHRREAVESVVKEDVKDDVMIHPLTGGGYVSGGGSRLMESPLSKRDWRRTRSMNHCNSITSTSRA